MRDLVNAEYMLLVPIVSILGLLLMKMNGVVNGKAVMKSKRNNKDLICENCQLIESTTLLFWEKYHQESGKTSLINPSIVCDKCKELFIGTKGRFENKPRLVPFNVIANQWDSRMQGLTSKSRYDFSVFRNPYFKKKLWRIKFVWKNAEAKAV